MRVCAICDTPQNLHSHHVFGGANRKVSEKYGMKEDLCAKHHNMSDYSVHFNKDLDLMFKKKWQTWFEDKYGHELFMQLIGRNYLEEGE